MIKISAAEAERVKAIASQIQIETIKSACDGDRHVKQLRELLSVGVLECLAQALTDSGYEW